MGTLVDMVPLSRDGTVKLPDPGSVMVRRINCAYAVREDDCEDFEAPFHEVAGGIVVGEVDTVEEVGPVA
jgi:hypothetical protein